MLPWGVSGAAICFLVLPACAEDWNAIALQAQQSGDYRRAAMAYSKLLAEEPQNPQLLTNLGIMFYLAGDDGEALRPLQAALKLAPALPPANLFLGLLFVRLNRSAEALSHLKRAHEADKNGMLPVLGLAKAYVSMREPRQANDYYSEAAAMDEKSAEAWLGLGVTYRGLLDLTAGRIGAIAPDSAEAKRTLSATGQVCTRTSMLRAEAAAVHEPKLGALIQLAKCYQSLALSALSKAIQLDPGAYQTHMILGEVLREQKKSAEAIREYETAIHIRPSEAAAYLALATVYWTGDDLEHTRPLIKQVLKLSPGDPEANAMMADILIRDGEFQKARPFALRAVQGNGNLAAARVSLAKVLMADGHPAEAVEELKHAVSSDPDGSYYYMLYRALLQLGRDQEAQAALSKFRERRALFRK